MPVLASAVRHFFVLYEVINTVNLEVHVEVYFSCLVHLDDPIVFVLSGVLFPMLAQT